VFQALEADIGIGGRGGRPPAKSVGTNGSTVVVADIVVVAGAAIVVVGHTVGVV
jgi:hypothetical protein